MAEIKSCGFLIFRDDPSPSFLLMRHPQRWDLPKGHVDEGESDMECALRELVEETGIRAEDIEIDPSFRFVHEYVVNSTRHGNRPKLKQLIVYLGKLIRPVDIITTEHGGYVWFAWEPPHNIQENTINPLLTELERHWSD